jgi:hypothetical protein
MRDTGEHGKVELWSAIADAYRVHSSKHGLLFACACKKGRQTRNC